MKMQIILLFLLSITINSQAGILSFFQKHDNTISAGIAGLAAAIILPPKFIKDKFLIKNPAMESYSQAGLLGAIMSIGIPDKIHSDKGLVVIGGTKLVAGLITYKLVKNYLEKKENKPK
jgi:hypothetical protein